MGFCNIENNKAALYPPVYRAAVSRSFPAAAFRLMFNKEQF